MTTIAVRAAPRISVKRGSQTFYVRMAAAFVLIPVVGFAPSYWTPMARGTLQVTPLVHLHAALFFGWTVLFFEQTRLASSGRIARHRALGVFGVSIATAMLFVGTATAIQGMRRGAAAGFGATSRDFAIVSITGILLFEGLFAAALLYVRRLEIHRRLMLVATASLLQAAIGRLFVLAFRPANAPPGPPPVAATIPAALVTDLLIVVAMVYDRRTRGRVHPAYWVSGGIVLAVQLARVPLVQTRLWAHVADWLVALLA